MPDASVQQLLSYISSASGPAILAMVIIAWLKGWIVTRREFDEASKQRDEWKEIALRDINNTDRLQKAADQLVEMLAKQEARRKDR
jgi:hypothetical protein